jgi:hypothetical protein
MDFWAFIVTGYLIFTLASQQEGIEGTARRISGNHMPSPKYHPSPPSGFHPSDSGGSKTARSSTSGRPTAATICVFRLTNQTQVTGAGKTGLYRSVQTPLVRQTDTDDSGHFRILLPPGTYSVFTKKGSLFYATRRDEKNNIAPVEVLPGKMTRVDCSVESDHAAVY